MTFAEVKSFWLEHGRQPRVQVLFSQQGDWHIVPCLDNHMQVESCTYRIHPDDLEKFMSNKPLDLTKPLAFRNRPDIKVIRHLHTLKGDVRFPAVFLIENTDGSEDTVCRTLSGAYFTGTHVHGPVSNSDEDIINVPERTEKFVNVYDNMMRRHASLEFARLNIDGEDVFHGTVKLVYEDGKLVGAEVAK